ncbi:MAG TPA: hypothetical protein VNM72_13910 [Blastocatellia bacterium]|nr:hypothetical protein [Blastocatellia bacterium]
MINNFPDPNFHRAREASVQTDLGQSSGNWVLAGRLDRPPTPDRVRGVLDVINADLLRCRFPLGVLRQFEFILMSFGLRDVQKLIGHPW